MVEAKVVNLIDLTTQINLKTKLHILMSLRTLGIKFY